MRAEPFAARTNAFPLFRSKKRYVRASFPLSRKINDLVWWFAHMPSCLAGEDTERAGRHLRSSTETRLQRKSLKIMAEASGSRTHPGRRSRPTPVLKTGRVTGPHALPRTACHPPFADVMREQRVANSGTRSSGRFCYLLVFGLRRYAEIGLQFLKAGEFLLRLIVAHRSRNDDVLSGPPIYWRRNIVPGADLKRVKDAHDLIEVSSTTHRIAHHHLDFLVGPNNEHCSHRGVVGRCPSFAALARFGRQHVVELGHFELWVANHGIGHLVPLRFFNVAFPFCVTGHGIDTQADDLGISFGELGLQTSHVSELGGADRREIFRMREQDCPTVTDPFVKIEVTLGGLGGEIRRFGIDSQRHILSSTGLRAPSYKLRTGGMKRPAWQPITQSPQRQVSISTKNRIVSSPASVKRMSGSGLLQTIVLCSGGLLVASSGKKLAMVQVDVFADRALEGNSLAVFLDGRDLSTELMQSIAREMNLSETTFIIPDDRAKERDEGVRVRIFTVQEELPFAGHPTLGTAFVLRGQSGAPEVRLKLNVGIVPVRFEKRTGQPVFGEMTQKNPTFGITHDRTEVARILGLPPADFDANLPIQTVSTGVPFTIAPLAKLHKLQNLHIDLQGALKYLESRESKFFYFVCKETMDPDARLHARMIFYNGEDPATGSAAGCCAAWAVAHGVVASEERVLIEQGVEMRRPSRIFVRATKQDNQIINVRVGGNCVEVLRGELTIPANS